MPRFGFNMDGDGIRAGFKKTRQIMIGPFDHEMNVEPQLRMLAHGRDDGGPERNVIDEMAVHDVEMKPVGTSVFHTMDLRFEIREIGGENGWSNQNRSHGVME